MARSLIAFLATLLFATAAIAAPPLPLNIDELQLTIPEWVDPFDTALNDGGAGEPTHWTPASTFRCGTAAVSGGSLVMSGPDVAAPCGNGTNVPAFIALGGQSEIRAIFEVPPVAEFLVFDSYGLQVGDGGLDFANLVVFNSGAGTTVVVSADPLSGGFATTVASAPVVTAGSTHIELRLTLNHDDTNDTLTPVGEYRLCASLPCAGAFLGLTPDLAHADGGILDASSTLGPGVVSFRNPADTTPYTRRVAEFGVAMDALDLLDDAEIGGDLPYSFACGNETDASEVGDVLTLLGTNAPCAAGAPPFTGAPLTTTAFSAAFFLSTPGLLTKRAIFEFQVPPLCTGYGVSVGVNEAAFPGMPDFAGLALFRGPNPENPLAESDVLAVLLSSEGEVAGPDSPNIARAIISTDPENDAALIGVTHIELELELIEVVGRVPLARYRLCNGTCTGPFETLASTTFTAFPNEMVCGSPAIEFDPPGTTGAITSLEGIGASFGAISVPEPGSVSAAAGALAGLALLARRRKAHAP